MRYRFVTAASVKQTLVGSASTGPPESRHCNMRRTRFARDAHDNQCVVVYSSWIAWCFSNIFCSMMFPWIVRDAPRTLRRRRFVIIARAGRTLCDLPRTYIDNADWYVLANMVTRCRDTHDIDSLLGGTSAPRFTIPAEVLRSIRCEIARARRKRRPSVNAPELPLFRRHVR